MAKVPSGLTATGARRGSKQFSQRIKRGQAAAKAIRARAAARKGR